MRRHKLFLQDSPNDCAAACLATILNHHGLYITPLDLVKNMELSRSGASNHELTRIAAVYHLQARMIKLPLEQFDRLTDPCIAYLRSEDGGHNVVIFGVKRGKLLIGDPALGKRRVTFQEFTKTYTGMLMIFRPTEEFQKGTHSQSYARAFLDFVMNYRTRIFRVLAISLLAAILGFGLVYLSKYFIDWALPSGKLTYVIYFGLAWFGARFLSNLTIAFRELLTVYIKNAVTRILGERFFEKTIKLEKRHYDSREPGDFLMLFGQIETITTGIANYFSQCLVVSMGIVIKATLLIVLYDPTLALIVLAIVALNTFVGFLFSRITTEYANRKAMAFGKINTTMINAIADVRVVRLFGAAQWLKTAYAVLLENALQAVLKITRSQVFGRSVADMLNLLSETAIFIICGIRIINGNYTIGDFLVFLTFAQGLAGESLQFPRLILDFQVQLRAFARLQALFHLDDEREGGKVLEGEGLEIEFRNVTFGYNSRVPVLRNVSFRLGNGMRTALVGESGSGKTTILNLILGFYKPLSGQVLVNGVDLQELDLGNYRERLSAVFQDTPIFNKDVYHNITLGRKGSNREEVEAVARELGIDSFIQGLPMNYRQLIYQGGISGGQAQRIGIMRAMCKPFNMLLLDEATSHLDSLNEARIVEGMNRICKSKGRLIIAHRLSTVKESDQIIVMHQGTVVEIGNHEELAAAHGYYHALIERQYEVNLTPATAPEAQGGQISAKGEVVAAG